MEHLGDNGQSDLLLAIALVGTIVIPMSLIVAIVKTFYAALNQYPLSMIAVYWFTTLPLLLLTIWHPDFGYIPLSISSAIMLFLLSYHTPRSKPKHENTSENT